MDTKLKKFKAITGFICFFLSISMFLVAIPALLSFLGSDFGTARREISDAFKDDYQNTDGFRKEISSRLSEAITMALGGQLQDYYEYSYDGNEVLNETNILGIESSDGSNATAVPTIEDEEIKKMSDEQINLENKKRMDELDNQYKKDKNLLYVIKNDGEVKYSSAQESELNWSTKTMPDGYNFLFYFDGTKAYAIKDGMELDLYGNGIYNGHNYGNPQWCIPGYSNFIAGEDASNVTVLFAVQKNPLSYVIRNFTKSDSSTNGSLYWVKEHIESQRMKFITLGSFIAIGLLLFVTYILLRKSKKEADKGIARLTGKVWFEVKLLVLIVPILAFLFIALYQSGILSMIINWQFYYYSFEEITQETGYILKMAAPVIMFLFWTLYLFINDIRYNKQNSKQGIFTKLSTKSLKLPIQKRMVHRSWAILAAVVIWAIPSVLLWIYGVITSDVGKEFSILVLIYLLSLFGVIALILKMYENNNAITDLSRLTDQIEAVRNGDLDTNLELPNDAELLHSAQSLNDIQHGMKASMDNQMKSERMKVELISNVSHDIKTPLTSIISYVDLLKQEENLPPHIKDYVTVLDEKSKRLKDMVQDVFEVSKAASGQLPIKLENLDFCKLLRQTIADMSEEIEASTVTLKTEIPEEAITINADGGRLYRVFQNLIQNSLKYSLDGSRIFILLKHENNKVTATVQNTSKLEIQSDIDFTQRFTRGDQSRTDGGSGLGLSIATSFTEACGGKFTVETIADLFIAKVEFNEIKKDIEI